SQRSGPWNDATAIRGEITAATGSNAIPARATTNPADAHNTFIPRKRVGSTDHSAVARSAGTRSDRGIRRTHPTLEIRSSIAASRGGLVAADGPGVGGGAGRHRISVLVAQPHIVAQLPRPGRSVAVLDQGPLRGAVSVAPHGPGVGGGGGRHPVEIVVMRAHV